jgi:Flp pilus assembly protein TadG
MSMMSFLRDRRGNVAMMFSLSVLPVFVGVGAAVDYSHLADVRERMQNSLDATVLSLSHDADALTSSQLQTEAAAKFAANFSDSSVSDLSVSASYAVSHGATVTATASGTVRLNIMGIMGIDSEQVSVDAKTSWASQRLRVALVLDNTGSMASNGKMTALKTATHNLLASLEAAVTDPGDVYVSIIPFAKDVNYGAGHYQEAWLSWSDWESKNGTRSCQWKNGYKVCTWTPAAHSTWNGCLMDRDQDYDIGNTEPNISAAYFYPEQYANCPASLTPMTEDWTALGSAVDAMTPTGSTNQTIGLSWGWLSLTQADPLNAPEKDADHDYKDVVILMTDGVNTQNRWSGNGSSQDSSVDARTALACQALKDADVEIYTVLVMDGNTSLLQGCATDNDHYFYLTDPDQLVTTFDAIGTKLSMLRISH